MLSIFFQNSKFRRFVIFRTFSSVGVGIFTIFMMWSVHAQYQNPFYTGLAGVAFAVLAMASFAIGPFVDRHNKAMLIRAACFVQFLAVGLILLVSLNLIPQMDFGIWFLLSMILIFNGAGLIGNVSGTALLPRIVDGEDLAKANAFIDIVSISVGIAGGLILFLLMRQMQVATDFSTIYGVNAAFMLVALITSIFLRSDEEKSLNNELKAQKSSYFFELKEGFAFIKRGAALFLLIVFIAQDMAASAAYVNLPMLIQVHTGEATGYIILTAFALMGGLIGSIVFRFLAPKVQIWKILLICFVFAGITRILFVNIIDDSFARSLIVYIIYVGLGGAVGLTFTTLMQKLPPKQLVARIATITVSLFAASTALGSLFGGILGSILPSVDTIFVIQGISYIIIGLCIPLFGSIKKLGKI
jgi:MFS family permease